MSEATQAWGHTSSSLDNGNLVILGGRLGAKPLDLSQVRLLSLGSSETTEGVDTPGAALADQRIAAFVNTIVATGAEPKKRYNHCAVTLPGNRLLIIGGHGGRKRYFSDVLLLSFPDKIGASEVKIDGAEGSVPSGVPAAAAEPGPRRAHYDSIETTGSLQPARRSGHAMSLVLDRYVYVCGGFNGSRLLSDIVVLDTVTWHWCMPGATLDPARRPPVEWTHLPPLIGHSMVTLPGTRNLLIYGGACSVNSFLDSVIVSDLRTGANIALHPTAAALETRPLSAPAAADVAAAAETEAGDQAASAQGDASATVPVPQYPPPRYLHRMVLIPAPSPAPTTTQDTPDHGEACAAAAAAAVAAGNGEATPAASVPSATAADASLGSSLRVSSASSASSLATHADGNAASESQDCNSGAAAAAAATTAAAAAPPPSPTASASASGAAAPRSHHVCLIIGGCSTDATALSDVWELDVTALCDLDTSAARAGDPATVHALKAAGWTIGLRYAPATAPSILPQGLGGFGVAAEGNPTSIAGHAHAHGLTPVRSRPSGDGNDASDDDDGQGLADSADASPVVPGTGRRYQSMGSTGTTRSSVGSGGGYRTGGPHDSSAREDSGRRSGAVSPADDRWGVFSPDGTSGRSNTRGGGGGGRGAGPPRRQGYDDRNRDVFGARRSGQHAGPHGGAHRGPAAASGRDMGMGSPDAYWERRDNRASPDPYLQQYYPPHPHQQFSSQRAGFTAAVHGHTHGDSSTSGRSMQRPSLPMQQHYAESGEVEVRRSSTTGSSPVLHRSEQQHGGEFQHGALNGGSGGTHNAKAYDRDSADVSPMAAAARAGRIHGGYAHPHPHVQGPFAPGGGGSGRKGSGGGGAGAGYGDGSNGSSAGRYPARDHRQATSSSRPAFDAPYPSQGGGWRHDYRHPDGDGAAPYYRNDQHFTGVDESGDGASEVRTTAMVPPPPLPHSSAPFDRSPTSTSLFGGSSAMAAPAAHIAPGPLVQMQQMSQMHLAIPMMMMPSPPQQQPQHQQQPQQQQQQSMFVQMPMMAPMGFQYQSSPGPGGAIGALQSTTLGYGAGLNSGGQPVAMPMMQMSMQQFQQQQPPPPQGAGMMMMQSVPAAMLSAQQWQGAYNLHQQHLQQHHLQQQHVQQQQQSMPPYDPTQSSQQQQQQQQ